MLRHERVPLTSLLDWRLTSDQSHGYLLTGEKTLNNTVKSTKNNNVINIILNKDTCTSVCCNPALAVSTLLPSNLAYHLLNF